MVPLKHVTTVHGVGKKLVLIWNSHEVRSNTYAVRERICTWV